MTEETRKLLATMDCNSIFDALVRGDTDLVAVLGKRLKYLPIEEIVKYLPDVSEDDHNYLGVAKLPFRLVLAGQSPPPAPDLSRFEKIALTHISIYTDLLHALPKKNAARIIYPFLLEQTHSMIRLAVTQDFLEILKKIAELWTLTTAAGLDEFYPGGREELDSDKLSFLGDQACGLDGICGMNLWDSVEEGNADFLRTVGVLFKAMGVSECHEYFRTWRLEDADDTLIDQVFELYKSGKGEGAEAYAELVQPFVSCDSDAGLILWCIGSGKSKFLEWQAALNRAGLGQSRFLRVSDPQARTGLRFH